MSIYNKNDELSDLTSLYIKLIIGTVMRLYIYI